MNARAFVEALARQWEERRRDELHFAAATRDGRDLLSVANVTDCEGASK